MVGQVYGWAGKERVLSFNFDMFTLDLSAYLVCLVFLLYPSRPFTYANA